MRKEALTLKVCFLYFPCPARVNVCVSALPGKEGSARDGGGRVSGPGGMEWTTVISLLVVKQRSGETSVGGGQHGSRL
jgi:hypothetical protein